MLYSRLPASCDVMLSFSPHKSTLESLGLEAACVAWLTAPVLTLAKFGGLSFTLYEMGRIRLCLHVVEDHIGWAGLSCLQHLSTTAETTSLRSQEPHFHNGLSCDLEANSVQKWLFLSKIASAGALLPSPEGLFNSMTSDCEKCLQGPQIFQH